MCVSLGRVLLSRVLPILLICWLLFPGCSLSTSHVEDLVEERLSEYNSAYGLNCPACSAECERHEYEVIKVEEREGFEAGLTWIKFYYSCPACEKENKPYSWSKTWCFSLRDKSQSFWKSLRTDWILPIRRYPKCLLFKLFSGDFFGKYAFAYPYSEYESIEKCESRFERVVNRLKGWALLFAIIGYLIYDAIRDWEKVKVFMIPLARRIRDFVFDFSSDVFDFALVIVENWWKILRDIFMLLVALQLLVSFWQYWNN